MKRILYIAIILLLGYKSIAQDSCSDERVENKSGLFFRNPKNGGEIISVGKYRLEVVVEPVQLQEKVVVYVYNKNFKPINLRDCKCFLNIRFSTGIDDSLNLTNDIDRFHGAPRGLENSVNLCFTLTVKDKEYHGCYFYNGFKK